MDDIFSTFRKMVAKAFKVELESVTPDARFREDFNADSLDVIEFMLEIEREFKIKLENEVLQDLVTVQDAYIFLMTKLGGGG